MWGSETVPCGPFVVGATNAGIPPQGGVQRYAVELTRELLARDPDLLALSASPTLREQLGTRVQASPLRRMATGNFQGNLARLLWHQTALPRRLRQIGASVFYSTVPDGMLAPVCPQLLTVHDVMPLRFPESAPRLKYYYLHIVPRLIRAATALVVTSEATRRDIEEFYGALDTPMHVVHQGYRRDVFRPRPPGDVAAVRRRHGLGRYLLAVGEARPYKNLRRLIEAFSRLGTPDLHLAIVGNRGRLEQTLGEVPRAFGVAERVKFLGYVSDEDLASLYGGAVALVFPSLFEGFGIPPLEAMASGCPVVAARAGSIPEVCGPAAIYVDPRDVDDIGAGMDRVVRDGELRACLRRQGLEQASRFSYGDAADRILGLMRVHAR